MNRRVLTFLSLVALLILNNQALAQSSTVQLPTKETSDTKTSQTEAAPVVKDWEPKIGSINSVIELRGYRLHPDDSEKIKVFFIQNSMEFPAFTKGGSSFANDHFYGEQTLDVIVPDQAAPGSGQFVVEFDGQRSSPAAVTITAWKAPLVKSVTPKSGPPGTVVDIECEGFHSGDDVEVTDAEGHPVNIGGGGSSKGTAFGIPDDAAEGVLTIRIGNRKYGNGQYSESFTFTVTNDPLPPDLIPSYMKAVAPGQWLELQTASNAALPYSERTEVAFKQAGRTVMVTTLRPSTSHVEVPRALSPGEVELQVRTWRNSRSSEWSKPVVISLADKPVAPTANAIRLLESGMWVQLWPGPDRATSFSVAPGDGIVINGVWPVADASKLKVSLLRAGEVVALRPVALNKEATWFGEVLVRLPKSLGVGEWRMIIGSETDASYSEVPLVIKVEQ